MPPDRLALLRKLPDRVLGAGTYGTVYAAMDMTTGCLYALKELPVSDGQGPSRPSTSMGDATSRGTDGTATPSGELSTSMCAAVPGLARASQAVRDEVSVLSRLGPHPHLVRYIGARTQWCAEAGQEVVQIFTEFVPGGSISSVVRELGALPEALAARFTFQIAQGLAHMHDRVGLVHRDLKGDNVLLDAAGACKIADYGAGKMLPWADGPAMMRTCVGTASFMAPEVIRGEPYGAAADIWSLGCTVYEMLVGEPPAYGTAGATPFAVLFCVGADDGPVPELPEEAARLVSVQAADLIARCCCRDPAARLTAAQVLEHPWLAEPAAAAAASAPAVATSETPTRPSVTGAGMTPSRPVSRAAATGSQPSLVRPPSMPAAAAQSAVTAEIARRPSVVSVPPLDSARPRTAASVTVVTPFSPIAPSIPSSVANSARIPPLPGQTASPPPERVVNAVRMVVHPERAAQVKPHAKRWYTTGTATDVSTTMASEWEETAGEEDEEEVEEWHDEATCNDWVSEYCDADRPVSPAQSSPFQFPAEWACHRCGQGMGLFGCDQCKAAGAPASLCAPCWAAVHPSNSNHRKVPPLVAVNAVNSARSAMAGNGYPKSPGTVPPAGPAFRRDPTGAPPQLDDTSRPRVGPLSAWA